MAPSYANKKRRRERGWDTLKKRRAFSLPNQKELLFTFFGTLGKPKMQGCFFHKIAKCVTLWTHSRRRQVPLKVCVFQVLHLGAVLPTGIFQCHIPEILHLKKTFVIKNYLKFGILFQENFIYSTVWH